MNSQKPVSVIIIFWNEEKFLQEAIDSVVHQTYSNWELLLVDDGSQDGSTACARSYTARYPDRIRYLEHAGHQNRGMSASRNLGIKHAAGEYVSFLDADDTLFPKSLEEQTALLEAYPLAALVYGPLYWWYGWKEDLDGNQPDFIEKLGVPSNQLIQPPCLVGLFLRNKAAVPSGFLVRMETIERVGGFEEAFKGEYEDQVFCAKVCLNLPIYAADHCWYRYRQHEESSVAIGLKTGRTYQARLIFLTWLETYLRAQRITNLGVWWALRMEQIPYQHKNLDQLSRRGQYYLERARYWLKFAQRWRKANHT